MLVATEAAELRSAALCTEGIKAGWLVQRLRANKGRVRRDFFARSGVNLAVEYDARGSIREATRSWIQRGLVVREVLGTGAVGKREQVLSWINQARIEKETNVGPDKER